MVSVCFPGRVPMDPELQEATWDDGTGVPELEDDTLEDDIDLAMELAGVCGPRATKEGSVHAHNRMPHFAPLLKLECYDPETFTHNFNGWFSTCGQYGFEAAEPACGSCVIQKSGSLRRVVLDDTGFLVLDVPRLYCATHEFHFSCTTPGAFRRLRSLGIRIEPDIHVLSRTTVITAAAYECVLLLTCMMQLHCDRRLRSLQCVFCSTKWYQMMFDMIITKIVLALRVRIAANALRR
jgi:hypothetical protein